VIVRTNLAIGAVTSFRQRTTSRHQCSVPLGDHQVVTSWGRTLTVYLKEKRDEASKSPREQRRLRVAPFVGARNFQEEPMKKVCFLSILVPLIGTATGVQAHTDQNVLVVTASNATMNQLLVYNSGGTLIQTIPTQGQGGVSGNAGGIEAKGKHPRRRQYALSLAIASRSEMEEREG
jgi:hypothetical protein